jgi:hypothetical protein
MLWANRVLGTYGHRFRRGQEPLAEQATRRESKFSL